MNNRTNAAAPPPVPALPADRTALPTPDFARRHFELPEHLDEPCTFAEWRAASLDLARLHRFTRGYRPLLDFLARTVTRTSVGCEPLHVVDVGCGHGDGLRTIYRWARKRSLPLRLTGIDLNPYAARLACERDRAEFIPAGAIAWVTGDVFGWQPEHPADLVISSLVLHHLSEADAVRLLRWCERQARLGWFATDLVRSGRAAAVYRWLARLLRLHPFLQHDGVVSFQRALRRDEWQHLLAAHEFPSVQVLSAGRGKLALEHLRR